MNKSVFAFVCSIALHTNAYAAPADCPQSKVEISRSPGTNYFVDPIAYDDQLEVYVNGTLVRTWRLNQDSAQQFKLIFLEKRVNQVRFVGFNRLYQKGIDHDPNPGNVGYQVSAADLAYRCSYAASWEFPEIQILFDHTYNFIDPSLPN
jgi:hypothetical protein